jgi:hypothetical protein
MSEEEAKSEGKKAGVNNKIDKKLDYFEGKASGDQGVYLKPVGTQEDNPFKPPKIPSSEVPSAEDSNPSQATESDSPSESSGD